MLPLWIGPHLTVSLAESMKSSTTTFGRETLISDPCIPRGLPISIDSFLDRQ